MIKILISFRETDPSLFEFANALYWPLLLFIGIDYVTGICVAIKQRKISSKIGFSGIFRKVLIFVTAFLGKVVDQYILASGNPTECAIILFYLSNEGISIIENLSRLGVPIPKFLAKTLGTISDDSAAEPLDDTEEPSKNEFTEGPDDGSLA